MTRESGPRTTPPGSLFPLTDSEELVTPSLLDGPPRPVRIVNGWSNHRGLSAWNLWLNNELVMYRYYERTGWPQDRLKGRREYRRCIVKAALLGWTPWQIRLRRAS